MGKGLFITATGTDVGKTYVTGLLVKALRDAGLNAGYYKAALSGAEITENGLLPGDADFVNRIAGLNEDPNNLVSYIYEEAISPHLAALHEGNPVELTKIVADYAESTKKYDFVTMEGSGGIVCPIRWDNQHILLEDIIQKLDLGTVVISGASLGSINACILTISYLREKNIPVHGIILNNYDENNFMQVDNKKMIEAIGGIPIIACVLPGGNKLEIDIDLLKSFYK